MAYSDERGYSAESRFQELSAKREPYLRRAREAASITIPALIPPSDVADNADRYSPAQLNGARGVNSLAAKILLAMMPPNIPVFRLEVNEVAQAILNAADQEAEKESQKVKENLARIPRAALLLTETFAHRPVVFEGIKHLIVAGNVLMWMMDDKKNLGKMRSVPLQRYVVQRDSLGFPLEIIVKDDVSASTLSPRLMALLQGSKSEEEILREASENKSGASTSRCYSLYTYACWDQDSQRYHFGQEFVGKLVPGTEGRYKEDALPFAPLCFTRGDGEDYGRGPVEEYIGVLQAIEVLSQSEAAMAVTMGETKWAVSPSSGIRARDLQNAPPNSYFDVEPGAVQSISAERYGDLAGMSASKDKMQRDFDLAFLVNTAIQRPGERVTAEEIRTMMQLLDNTLGGLYSSLAADFQKQYAAFQLRLLKKTQGVDIGTSGAIRPRIVTGIEALGQSAEAMQFIEACKVTSELVGPQAFAMNTKVSGILSRIFGYFNVEPAGIAKSDEELAQEQAQAAQQEENSKVAPVIAGAAAKAITQ